LGEIKGMKVLIALLDNLPSVKEQSMLLAVVGALDKQIDGAVGRNLLPKFKEFAEQDPGHWENVLTAVAQAGALEMFAVLVGDPDMGGRMIESAKQNVDHETAEAFKQKLAEAGDPRADLIEAAEKASDRPTMLAVDDSGAMRSFYRASADELGVDVTVAENGRAAWDMLEAGSEFDVIVVDMNMPEMDGIELTTHIRGKEELADTPIVMATTESEKSQAQLAKKAGVNAFLVKPFKADILANKIRKYLPES
jgi:CheY-like chemotaxis protein